MTVGPLIQGNARKMKAAEVRSVAKRAIGRRSQAQGHVQGFHPLVSGKQKMCKFFFYFRNKKKKKEEKITLFRNR
jgi:hypothetical protein